MGSKGTGIALAALLTVALAGCGGSGSKHSATKLSGTVTLGVLAPLEHVGTLGERGKDLMQGAKLAVAQINANGGVLGKRVRLEPIDDACNNTVGYEAAKAFGEGGDVAGVIGGMCDQAAYRESGVIDASGIPFMVTTATADVIAQEPLQSTYLMNGTVYQQALSTVFWMNYRSAERLAVIDDSTPESKELGAQAIKLVDQVPKLVSEQMVPTGATNMTTVAKAALVSKPNFILWTGSAAGGGALAAALHKAGFKGTFTATAASDSPAFLAAAGKDGANGAYITATSTAENTPTASKWLGTFRGTYHRDPGLDAIQAYDSVRVIAHAITKAKTTDPQKVSKQIAVLDPNLTNFLGVIRFAKDHTLLYDNRVILQVKKGQFTWKRSLRTDSLG